MPDRQKLARFLSDAGLAAWFGGSLAGALGKAPAPAAFDAAAIGTHLAGAAMLPRSRRQKLLTLGAVGTTAYTRYLGNKADDEAAQKQLAALQWAVPGLTGAVLATSHESKPTLRSRVNDAKALATTAAAAALPAAKHALAAAAPTAERARDAAVPALKHAREQAGPVLKQAREQAGPALQAAKEAAVPALERARDTAVPAVTRAAERARETAAPAVSRAREALPA